MNNTLEISLLCSTPHYSQQTEIGGKTYGFEFEWLDRSGFWLLHIYDDVGTPIVLGIKLVDEWPLLRRQSALPFDLMMIAKVEGPCLLVLNAL